MNTFAVTDLVLAHRQQDQPQQNPVEKPSTNKPQQSNHSTTTQQGAQNGALDSEEQAPQGDWGEMPVEEVAIGLSRQLDPDKFSNNVALTEKKKH